METVKVKVCGLTREEDVESSLEAGADLLGFIVYTPESPRNIPLDKARRLMELVGDAALKVAVTRAPLRKLDWIVEALKPDYIQVHGRCIPAAGRAEEIPEGVGLIWAVSMSDPEAVRRAEASAEFFHDILLDTGRGGTGETHNWLLSRHIRDMIHPARVYLAGGLNPGNVREAVRIVRPYCVDASSGLEGRPGVKDPLKIRAFISRAKGG